MPALPAASKVLRVALSGIGTSPEVWLTRFYIQYTGTAPTAAQLATFDGAISTAYNTNIKPLVNTGTRLTQIASTDLSSSTGAVDVSTVSILGTRAGDTLPAQVCTVVSYTIARRYRGGHPRGYWPLGVFADQQSAVSWSSTFLTAVNTGVNALFTAIAAAGWTGAGTLSQVNVSYYSGFTVVTNPTTHRARNVPTVRVSPVIDPVTAIHAQASIGTQRRREAFVD
jgi:hypothetical protein